MTVDAAALDDLTDLADLLAQRIALDARIGAIIGRPSPCRAHGGVDRLEGLRHPTRRLCRPKQSTAGSDPARWPARQSTSRSTASARACSNSDPTLDYYLVLCGPKATTLTSKGGTRPLRVTNVYLFDSAEIRTDQQTRGTKSGVASSIRSALWTEAEIYPRAHPALKLDAEQRRALALFDWST